MKNQGVNVMEITQDNPIVTENLTEEMINQKIAVLKNAQKSLEDAIETNLLPENIVEQMKTLLVFVTIELQQYEGCALNDEETEEPDDEIEVVDANDNDPTWDADESDFNCDEDGAPLEPPVDTPPKEPVPPTPGIKYAPNLTPVHGTFKVCGISVQWNNNNGAPKAKVGSAARALATNYSRLSNGQLIFKPTTRVAKVGLAYNRKNVNNAVNKARSIVNGGTPKKFDRYVIVTGGLGTSHAGGNSCVLRGTLKRDWWHEMGHVLPNADKQRALGHAGKYVTKNGKTKLDAYGDGSSFMGRFSTNNINPPQRYHLGWAGDNKTAQYDLGDGEKQFKVSYPYSKNIPDDAVTGVLIPRTEGRPLFASIIPVQKKLLFAVWYMTGGGTQRTAVFNKSATVDGLFFQRLATNGNSSTLSIGPAPTPVVKATDTAAAATKPKNKPSK